MDEGVAEETRSRGVLVHARQAIVRRTSRNGQILILYSDRTTQGYYYLTMASNLLCGGRYKLADCSTVEIGIHIRISSTLLTFKREKRSSLNEYLRGSGSIVHKVQTR